MFKVKVKDFDLKNTFENGQCFRFNPYKGGYLGIALGEVIYLEKTGRADLWIDGVDAAIFDRKFVPYFDLQADYSRIAASFPQEENLRRALEYGRGMRILRQDPWETLLSFVISQNNHIGRIKAIVERLCSRYGSPLAYDGSVFYTFPTAEQLKDVSAQEYAALGCGYRAGYLEEIVKNKLEGKINLDRLQKCGYDDAKEQLLVLKGVGPKVADCILLFGLGYTQAFPVDTWIKKVMETLYLKKSASKAEIEQFAYETFGSYAGFAQQCLFYYAREHRIKGIEEIT